METVKIIEACKAKQKYIRLTRTRGDFNDSDRGYIVAYSSAFVLLQVTDDFSLNGFSIIPIDTIKEIRHNKDDKFYGMIMKKEQIKGIAKINFNIDLSDWQSIFNSLKSTKVIVTIECEEPHLDYFCIGSIARVGKNQVSQLYFTPDGFIDNAPTVTKYKNITKVTFDNRYGNVMGKYLRHHK